MKIVAIDDLTKGHHSQISGVISRFKEDNITFIYSRFWLYKVISVLPLFIIERILFLLRKKLNHIEECNLIISVGMKSSVPALYLKKKYPKAKLVFLMPSRKISYKHGDLVFYNSSYKKKINKETYYHIKAAPHNIDINNIKENSSKFIKSLRKFQSPIVSVIVGGGSPYIKLDQPAINDLVSYIKKIQHDLDASICITTSRRTKPYMESYFKEQIQSCIPKKRLFFWGYYEHNNIVSEESNNPYIAMLKCSDHIIVTGDSISMISEACSLPSNIGVYIFYSKHFFSSHYFAFHQDMYENNYAKHIDDFSENVHRVSYNSTDFIANKIKSLI